MILISRKVDYAILALCHLMRRPNGASARELADHYGLSRPFIANILKLLCSQGFIDSQRGVNGGYRLARDPSLITLDEVITSLEGPFQLMSCANPQGDSDCMLVHACPVRAPLRLVHDRLLATLADVTLEDLGGSDPQLVALDMENKKDGFAADLPRQ